MRTRRADRARAGAGGLSTISLFLAGSRSEGIPMTKSRVTDPPILTIPEERDAAVPVAQRARPKGISAANHFTAMLAQ
jgi:hypothetical protein